MTKPKTTLWRPRNWRARWPDAITMEKLLEKHKLPPLANFNTGIEVGATLMLYGLLEYLSRAPSKEAMVDRLLRVIQICEVREAHREARRHKDK